MKETTKIWTVFLLGLLYWVFHQFIVDVCWPHFENWSSFLVFQYSTNIAFAIPVAWLSFGKGPKPTIKNPAIALMFVIGVFTLSCVLATTWAKLIDPGRSMPFGAPTQYENSHDNIALRAIFLAPILEEIVCRMGLVGAGSKLIGRFPALILSSVLFAFMHLHRASIEGIPPYIATGLLFGMTYLILGIRWSILAHMLQNAVAGFLIPKGYWLDSSLSLTVVLVFACTVIAGLVVLLFQVFKHRRHLVGR